LVNVFALAQKCWKRFLYLTFLPKCYCERSRSRCHWRM